tara:strand:- start:895 stop:1872 length:978 start_codon:yes stop_codon:yes gene_type:complete
VVVGIKKLIYALHVLTLLIFTSCKETFQEEPQENIAEEWKIISLAPSLTSILIEFGLSEHIAAVDSFSKKDSRFLDIGGFIDPNYELITTIKPTHMVGLTSHSKIKERLDFMNAKWILNPSESLGDYFQTIHIIGNEFNKKSEAEKHLAEITKLIESLRELISTNTNCKLLEFEYCQDEKRIIMIISRKPGETTNMLAAGKETFLSEIIEKLGVKNAIKNQEGSLNPYWPNIGAESLIAINPDEIWEFGEKNDSQDLCCDDDSFFYPYQKLKNIKAIKNKKIKLFQNEELTIPGTNIKKTLIEFAIELYPEIEAEIKKLIKPARS